MWYPKYKAYLYELENQARESMGGLENDWFSFYSNLTNTGWDNRLKLPSEYVWLPVLRIGNFKLLRKHKVDVDNFKGDISWGLRQYISSILPKKSLERYAYERRTNPNYDRAGVEIDFEDWWESEYL